MKRLLTAAVGVPLVLAAIFLLATPWFFLVCAFALGWAAYEFSTIAASWAPDAPIRILPALSIVLAALLSFSVWPATLERLALPALGVALVVGLGCLILFSRTPMEQAPAALGALTYGTLYFAVPIASLCQLQRRDPWLVFLLIAIVWLGDTAAYYVGSAWGHRRLAPTVSPKKTWEGAVAGLAIGILATVVWSYSRLGRLIPELVLVGIVTAVAAQIGDLVESVFKRASGIKDSGRILPGHGGVLDRADALLFAAPVLWLGWLALEPVFFTP